MIRMQGYAAFTPAEKLLLVNVHPGLVLGSHMKEWDNADEPIPWNDGESLATSTE